MAGDAEGLVDDFSFSERLLVPASDQFGVIRDFEGLNPGLFAGEALVGLEGELNRSPGLSESVKCFAVRAGGPVEIGSIDGPDLAFE